MKVSIIGIGNMGKALATAILNSGQQNEVIVYNRTKSKAESLIPIGARVVDTIVEAINQADIIVLVVLNGEAFREIILTDGALSSVKGKHILNASTVSMEDIEWAEKQIHDNGGQFSEMSMLVGPKELTRKEGKFLIGCSQEKELLEQLLTPIGECLFVGKVGDATKAVPLQYLLYISLTVGTAYSVALSSKLNIPQHVTEHMISTYFPEAENLLPNMFSRNYDNNFLGSTNTFVMGVSGVIETLKSSNIPSQVFEQYLNLFQSAIDQGFGDKDYASIVESLLNEKRTKQ